MKWLVCAAWLAAATPALAQDGTIRTIDPGAAAPGPVRDVEISGSVFADGVTDPEEIEHRQVRNLNGRIADQLAAGRLQAQTAEQEHQRAVAAATADRQRYDEALARHRAEMEEWQRAVDAQTARPSRKHSTDPRQ